MVKYADIKHKYQSIVRSKKDSQIECRPIHLLLIKLDIKNKSTGFLLGIAIPRTY